MKTQISLIITIGLFSWRTTQAQGSITYLSNIGQTPSGSLAVASNSWLAEAFQTGNNGGGYTLDSVQLGMANATGNPSGFKVMIYSAVSTVALFPGSNLGALGGSTDPSTAGTYTYADDSNLILSPNTDYFIVLTAGTAVANGSYNWNLTGTYSYNPVDGWGVLSNEGTVAVYEHSANGSSWAFNDGNPEFAINATPVPEPSLSSLLLLGGGLVVFVRKQKLAPR